MVVNVRLPATVVADAQVAVIGGTDVYGGAEVVVAGRGVSCPLFIWFPVASYEMSAVVAIGCS